MNRNRLLAPALAVAVALAAAPAVSAREPSFAKVSAEVNEKLVKLFGSGGIKGLASYGTGVIVSPDGYILTVNSHILDTQDLRVHLADGTRYHAKVVAVEPELDIALVKIGDQRQKLEEALPFFDVFEAAKRPPAAAGTGILAFSNQFQIATRDEPMSVQRGVIATYAQLHGKIGIFDAPYTGQVYVIDAITNNPGAAGGVITTRKGELLGLIGKELRNDQTNTWINYAVPMNALVRGADRAWYLPPVGITDLVEKKEKYRPVSAVKKERLGGGYTGIVLVPNVVERTPPYVDDIDPGSPAHKAGLKRDDLIVYVDGLPVNSINNYKEYLERYRPGMEVKLEVRRGDRLQTITVTLEKYPPGKEPPLLPKPEGDPGK